MLGGKASIDYNKRGRICKRFPILTKLSNEFSPLFHFMSEEQTVH